VRVRARPPAGEAILAVNAGSSSLKLTVFGADPLSRQAAVTIDRIGIPGTRLRESADPSASTVDAPDFDAALHLALDAAARRSAFQPAAVGHRVVHGGSSHAEPEVVSAALIADLRTLESIDPTHMPQTLRLIEAAGRRYPELPQFACFDTAFHRSMPSRAQRYPLPRSSWTTGVRRYGFHGLSCESILEQLQAIAPSEARGRLLIAHLGNGASITAVQDGVSVDTTMGFSPTGGLMMGTRSGDLDPTVVTYLARTTGSSPEALERLLSQESGLLGVSGVSSDMEDLLNRRDDPQAREAVDLYCYTARKQAAALVAALNGLDTIVFTGGIGEHAPAIRAGICAGLEHLGLALAPAANAANQPVISTPDSRIRVRVIATDEDRVIARHVRRLLAERSSACTNSTQQSPA